MSIRLFRSSLQLRAVLVLLLAGTPPLAVLRATVVEWRRHELEEAEAVALRLARHAGATHDRMLEEAAQLLAGLSQVAILSTSQSPIPGSLRSDPADQPAWANVGVVRLEGTRVASIQPAALRGGDIEALPVFRRAVERRAITVGDYEIDPQTGGRLVTVFYPLVDRRGRVDHVLFAELDAGWLRGWVTDAECPDGTTVSILDSRGTVVMEAPGSTQWSGPLDPGLARAIAGREEATLEGTTADGVRRVFGVRPIQTDSGTLHIVIGIPRAAVVAYVEGVVVHAATGFGLALLLAGFVAVAGSRWTVVRPLRKLQAATARLSRGDLAARAGLRGAPAEVEQLASAFDDMAATLQVRENEVARHTECLARQERRFRALIEHAADGVVLIDQDAVVSYASPSVTRMLGYAPAELAGRCAFDFVHPADRLAESDRLGRAVAEPWSAQTSTARFRHKDGSWRWLESVATNMLDDPAVGAIVGNYRDVTARLESEEMLRRAHDELEARVVVRTTELSKANADLQEEIHERARVEETLRKLSRVIEQTSDSVFLTDRRGIIEYVNPAFEQASGFSREEAIGATPRLISSGRQDQRFYQGLWRTILAGRVFRSVLVNRAKDGREYFEDLTITPLRDSQGAITHFVSTGRDITRNRRTQEALRRMNDRFELEAARIAGALHDDAGQLLTWAHVTLADVARDVSAPSRDRLEDVRRHLDDVEEQLRGLAHELHPRVLDDLGLVEALKFLADGVTRRTGIAVTVDASVDSRCCSLTQRALYRLVQEGLHNVTRHAGATHVAVVIESDDQNVRCTVRDNGAGFDVAMVAARRDRSGLGLPGIRDRLEAVCGILEIASVPGVGTTLTATVPLEEGQSCA